MDVFDLDQKDAIVVFTAYGRKKGFTLAQLIEFAGRDQLLALASEDTVAEPPRPKGNLEPRQLLKQQTEVPTFTRHKPGESARRPGRPSGISQRFVAKRPANLLKLKLRPTHRLSYCMAALMETGWSKAMQNDFAIVLDRYKDGDINAKVYSEVGFEMRQVAFNEPRVNAHLKEAILKFLKRFPQLTDEASLKGGGIHRRRPAAPN